MNVELVTIGTELLLGFTVDTNGAHIARELAAVGVRVVRRTTVVDTPDEVRGAVAAALDRTGAVITTGGLGPTKDDLTKRAVAQLLDRELDWDETIWAALLERFARFGRAPVESNREQAFVPRGATVLPNRWGTAPGLWIDDSRGLVVMLPGVPREMHRLLEHEVMPRLRERGNGEAVQSLVVRTTGIPESTLAERLGDVEDTIAPLTLAYLPGLEGVDLRVTAWDMAPTEAGWRLAQAAETLRTIAGEHAYGTGDDDLAAVLLDTLRRRGATLAVAESCTGGMLGSRLTAIPGSSDVFTGGMIAYANAAKTGLLGVPAALIEAHGAVSEEVARAMAEGAAARLEAAAAIAVTGVAGPGGGTAEKPVGTVWVATLAGGAVRARRLAFGGERDEVRVRAAQTALYLLLRHLAAPE